MKKTLITLALFAAFSAHATGDKEHKEHKPKTGNTTVTVTPNVKSSSASNSNSNSNSASDSLSTAATNANQTIKVDGDVYAAQKRDPVSSVVAPAIMPTAVCALGISAGAQGVAFGLAFGTSYIDKNCELLEQVRAANALGMRAIAVEMMTEFPAFKAATERVEARRSGKLAAVPPQEPATYTDPYIRARLGLAPL